MKNDTINLSEQSQSFIKYIIKKFKIEKYTLTRITYENFDKMKPILFNVIRRTFKGHGQPTIDDINLTLNHIYENIDGLIVLTDICEYVHTTEQNYLFFKDCRQKVKIDTSLTTFSLFNRTEFDTSVSNNTYFFESVLYYEKLLENEYLYKMTTFLAPIHEKYQLIGNGFITSGRKLELNIFEGDHPKAFNTKYSSLDNPYNCYAQLHFKDTLLYESFKNSNYKHLSYFVCEIFAPFMHSKQAYDEISVVPEFTAEFVDAYYKKYLSIFKMIKV